jgi:hypothetical protein
MKKKTKTKTPPVKTAMSAHRTTRPKSKKQDAIDAPIAESTPFDQPGKINFKPQVTDKRIFDILKKNIRRNAKLDRWMPH